MSTATYKNLAGFSPEKIELLEKDFADLNESGSDLAERAVRYVVDGEDANVLEALAKAHEPADRLRLIGSVIHHRAGAYHSEARVAFFSDMNASVPEAYLRLAKVYAAASQGGPPANLHYQAYYGHLPWLEIFLAEATRGRKNHGARGGQPSSLSVGLLEKMLIADGQDPALLIKTVCGGEKKDYMRPTLVAELPGFRESVVKHRDVVSAALAGAATSRIVEILETLATYEVPAEPFLEELASLATCGTKRVREAAAALLSGVREHARPLMENIAVRGSPPERAAAARWLARFAGEGIRDFLLARQQIEKYAKLQEAISEALKELEPARTECGSTAHAPPLAPVETNVPLSVAARQAVSQLLDTYNRVALQRNQQSAQQLQQYPNRAQHNLPIYDQSHVDKICQLLETTTDLSPFVDREPYLAMQQFKETNDCLLAFAAIPKLHLIHLIRLLGLLGYITERHWGRPMMLLWCERYLKRFYDSHPPGFALRELAAVLQAVGVDSRVIGYDLLSAHRANLPWMADQFASYFAEHLDLLVTGLENRPLAGRFDYEWRDVRAKVFGMISRFPQVPPSLVGRIWQIAIGSAKTDRAAAQKATERVSDLRQRLADALASGDYQTRIVAAEWLGRTRDKYAAELLHKALKKEKQEAAKDAMLTALERLGEPIDRYLHRDQLLAEAERGLKKGLHKDLDWFPVNSWPEVHWHDTDAAVPQEILNWFLMQTYKLGSPEAGALLRRYCLQFAPEDREALGKFVLTTWMEYDGRPKFTEAEARQLAKQEAQKTSQAVQHLASKYPQIHPLMLAEWEEHHYQTLAAQKISTAIKVKGVLALAAACCGDEAVTIVGDYLKQWYGYRAAQCRALIAMLASLDRPPAIQLLLSVANRFRTKSIREEAEKYVKIVSERKGWTIDELADRTVPTAGFDDTLTLALDYGPRQLTARLRPDFSIELADENGKPLKSLPEPRKDDDPDKAKAAKKQLSAAKSELKKLLAQQTARFYEAMCTERAWSYADWEAFVRQHPIVGRLCQRLVWAVVEGDGISQTFRPLDDGTLTDEHDEQVVVPTDARLKLAHGSLLSQESSAAWTRHLADYEVEPLFSQFGRDRYLLTEEKRDATNVSDFVGYLIEAFKLRGLATRLGYTRGPAQDGGWFYEYEKTLAGMGLKVVLRFSGNGMPEQNRTVALMDLHFSPTGGESAGISFGQPGIPLRDVPGVLLSECYHDAATIATAGSGYDADWQKKVGI